MWNGASCFNISLITRKVEHLLIISQFSSLLLRIPRPNLYLVSYCIIILHRLPLFYWSVVLKCSEYSSLVSLSVVNVSPLCALTFHLFSNVQKGGVFFFFVCLPAYLCLMQTDLPIFSFMVWNLCDVFKKSFPRPSS